MKPKPHPPVEMAEPTADEVLADTLSLIRGEIFGPLSTEVKLLRQMLRNDGFDIYRVRECAKYRLSPG